MATLFGHTFYDGKAEEIEVDDNVLGKLKGISAFTVGGEKPDTKSKQS
jgi:hypothetical protein